MIHFLRTFIIIAERPRARSPILIENGNLSTPENLVMTSAYSRCPSVRTTLGVGVKTSVDPDREGSPRRVRCVSFWNKINHFRGYHRK